MKYRVEIRHIGASMPVYVSPKLERAFADKFAQQKRDEALRAAWCFKVEVKECVE